MVYGISSPKLNKPIPNINSTVEAKKVITSNFEKLVSLVQNKIITIANIGKTDIELLLIFQ